MKNYHLLQTTAVLFFILVHFSACSKKENPKPPVQTPISLSVNKGPYNTSVVITGTGFSTTIGDDKVFFNGNVAVTTAATATQLTATVPLGAGSGAVTVKLKNGTVLNGPDFTYQLSLVVSTFAGSGDGGFLDGTGTAASFNEPAGLAVDAAGNVYVADQGNNSIRKITSAGVVSTLAGSGTIGATNGTGKAASFNAPAGVAVDASGNVFVADYVNNLIRKITPAGVVTTFAGNSNPGTTNGTGAAASFNNPTDLAIDNSGNIFVADYANSMIRKITPAGLVSTFAGSVNTGSADGTGAAATFDYPVGITMDASGNLYVTDSFNFTIRKITPAGVVTTFAGSGNRAYTDGTGTAASFKNLSLLAVDKNGNLYVIDTNMIRKVDPNAVVTSVIGSGAVGSADGAALQASFNGPAGVAVDASGNIYIADAGNNLIRKATME
jgi:streptogramin lyase